MSLIVLPEQKDLFKKENQIVKQIVDLLFGQLNTSLIYLAVILILLINHQSFAQQDIERSIKKGLELSYQFNWNEAEKIFTNLIDNHPELPSPYHYYSGIFLWYFLSSYDETDLENFTMYSDTAIDKAKNILEENPDDIDVMYILGANYNYRAIAFARAENYLDAIWASKKSESYLSEVLTRKPDYADAHLGLGLYSFSVSQVPSAFSWALNLAGIQGSIEEGLKHIRIAADEGEYSKVEAQYYLSQILSGVVFDFDEAAKHLTKLSKKYPANLVFNYSLAVIDIKNRKLDAAERILNSIVKSNQTKFRKVIAFSNFLLGDVHFKQNEFSKSITFYEHFLEATPDKDYTGIAAYRLALSYELTGNRAKAEEYFGMCGKGNMDLEDDVYAKRRGSIFYKRTLAETESDLIRFVNLIDNAKYKVASDSLKSLLTRVKTEKLKAEIYYHLSEAAYLSGQYSQSAELAERSLSVEQNEEKWVTAFAYYNAARAYHQLKDFISRDKYLELAEENNEYDYQSVLKNQLYVLKLESKSL